MGKNKKYDLAKRQEKILKRMAKPLYKKSDNSTYFVITQPFGMHRSPAQRGIVDINRLVSWISWVFRRESVVETVYTMSTRDEIIVRIAEGAVSARFLGKHKYNNILTAGWPWDPDLASCVFAYNYDVNGDPSNRAYTAFLTTGPIYALIGSIKHVVDNWREHVASDADVPPGHFRNPYPVPTWAVRPSHLSSLARALPDSLPHTPRPSPEPPSRTPTNANAQREDAKQEPGYTSHDTNNATAEPSSSAQGRVKVEPFSQTVPLITAGEPAYEPTQELRNQIALLNASRAQSIRVNQEPVTSIKRESSDSDWTRSRESYGAPATGVGSSDRMPPGVKQEPRDDHLAVSDVEPSQALWKEWARYQMERQTPGDPAALVKQESHPSQFMTQPPIAQSSGSFDLISRVSSGSSPSFQKDKRESAAGEGKQSHFAADIIAIGGNPTDVRPWKRSKPGIN
ncbi:hypothetical protein BC826DRAFT_1101306 [Russula brevipes]|nr:hypothetical protein BC826DRAFT_1101306 [Russula brevipes]